MFIIKIFNLYYRKKF